MIVTAVVILLNLFLSVQTTRAVSDFAGSITCLCYTSSAAYQAMCGQIKVGGDVSFSYKSICKNITVNVSDPTAGVSGCNELAKQENNIDTSVIAQIQCEPTGDQAECGQKSAANSAKNSFKECLPDTVKGKEGETKNKELSTGDLAAMAKEALNRTGQTDIKVALGSGVSVIMGILGSIALAMFVYAGFLWMVSGTMDSVEKARSILVWSSMGMVIIFASYALVQLIFATF